MTGFGEVQERKKERRKAEEYSINSYYYYYEAYSTYSTYYYLMNRYYEGKEYQVRITDKKPGQLSDRLRVGSYTNLHQFLLIYTNLY